MRLSQLTFLGFYLNGAAGSGKYDDIDIETVKRRIDDGSVFDWLHERLGHDLDLSILTVEGRAELLQRWQDYVSAIDEHRKLAVDRGGLNLLVAYLLQGIQELAQNAGVQS